MCRRLPVVFLSALFVLPGAMRGDEGIPAKKLDELKAATVYVKVEGGEWAATGSGFLIQVDGDTGLIVTNHHVVETPRGFSAGKVSLVLWSGSKKEKVLAADIVASDAERDLAVLKVTSKDLPKPLDLSQKVELRETMPVYTFGFPLGDLLSTTKGNPAMTIGKATVSSVREDDRGKVSVVQLDGEVNPGNSGGPVTDAEGKLVGIVVAKIEGTKICFAIPPTELTAMLGGRISALGIEIKKVEDGVAEVALGVQSLDPLKKIGKIEIRYVRKDALKEQPKANDDGTWAELPGSEKVAVKFEDQKAGVTLKLKCADKKRVHYWFQPVYVDGTGKTIALEPGQRAIDFRPADQAGLLAHWKLDEGKGSTAEDETDKLKATLHGGRWVEGIKGQALQFDGDGDYLDYGDTEELNFQAGDAFTFSGWVKSKAQTGGIVSQRNSKEEGAVIDLTLTGGKLQALVRADGKVVCANVAGKAINDGEWHHFALTRDRGRTIELFIDGVSQGKASQADAEGSITTNLRALGSERLWVQTKFPTPPQLIGAVDDFRVYDRALSVEEIRKLAVK